MDVQCILAQRLSKTVQRLYKSTNISQHVFVKCVSLCVYVDLQELNRHLASGLLSSETPGSSPDHILLWRTKSKGQKGLPIYSLLTCKNRSCYILFPLTYLTCHLMLFGRLELNKICTGRWTCKQIRRAGTSARILAISFRSSFSPQFYNEHDMSKPDRTWSNQ